MTTVLLIRHGMTDAVGQRIVGWLPGVGLNVEGLRQVARLRDELQGVKLDAIYQQSAGTRGHHGERDRRAAFDRRADTRGTRRSALRRLDRQDSGGIGRR